MAASETETPLIIAVPEFEFERWTRFSNRMTIKLDWTLDPVLGWWNGVSRGNSPRIKPDHRACELFK